MRMPVEQTLEVPSLALQRGGQALARRHLDPLAPLVEVRLRQLVNLDAAHAGSATVHDACLS